MRMSEMALLICKASNDDGEAVIEQFLETFGEALRNEVIIYVNRCLPQAFENWVAIMIHKDRPFRH